MLFPDNLLFENVLIALGAELAARPVPPINPLPCDRWIARSCLQKAVRRGRVDLAQRALANLYEHDRRSVWRHITIIALEDVGVANIDVLACIVAAQRDKPWRQDVGGDWAVMAELVRQMAESSHCQAACDLLLKAINDPGIERLRATALESDMGSLAAGLWDTSATIEIRALAALAMGGGLADRQQHNDPSAVFDVLSEASRSTDVVSTCRSAWKLTRNPMALLLSLVWEEWTASDHHVTADNMPPVTVLNEVPGYSLDQFTRTGNQISRAYLAEDRELQRLFELAGIRKSAFARTFGDVIFLNEGGLLASRMVWEPANRLRQPHRWLPAVAALKHHLPDILRHCEAKASHIEYARRRLYPS